MGETLSLFQPSFNGSVRVETRTERLSGDAGFVLLRKVLDDTGLIRHLSRRLHDPRRLDRMVYSMPELPGTSMVHCSGFPVVTAREWGLVDIHSLGADF